ncbi:MAG: methyltransferase RsmF C-terminal domain-like protein [Eisenbergiella sp.]
MRYVCLGRFPGKKTKITARICLAERETFPLTGEKGWYLITVDGYSIGWGNWQEGL